MPGADTTHSFKVEAAFNGRKEDSCKACPTPENRTPMVDIILLHHGARDMVRVRFRSGVDTEHLAGSKC